MPVEDTLGFDPMALKARYRAERDKRLGGDRQSVEMTGALRHYLDDPHAGPPAERPALADTRQVVVIGGGFGGMLAAARLREAGVDDIRIIEKGGGFGGTWYWNRYPGAACDIDSSVYLPLLEETGFLPERKYSPGPEIRAHAERVASHYDLHRDVLFQTEVTDLSWDEAATRWTVATNRGDRIRARFVVMANGPLHRPKLPAITGIQHFEGRSFHTSRWDYGYTGGGEGQPLDRLGDKAVGIIGTGATAVQVVPHLAAAARHLYVFQRTPSSIDVRNDRPTDPAWARSLRPGWHRSRMENFNTLVSGGWAEEDLVADGWTDIVRNLSIVARLRGAASPDEAAPAELVQLADFRKMEAIRARVDSIVGDPAVAEALKPYYNQLCKRPCFHDDYLPAFNRANVSLVDTQGKGVERITRDGVIVAGKAYRLDCLIFATGFEVGTSHRSGYAIRGIGGRTLDEKWSTGAASLHGLTFHGFPNCFLFSSTQSGLTVNYPHMLDEQARHSAFLIAHAIGIGRERIEPSRAAEQAWTREILDAALEQKRYLEECTPGYYNNEGDVDAINASFSPYGRGPAAFFEVLEDWRRHGGFEGLDFAPANPS